MPAAGTQRCSLCGNLNPPAARSCACGESLRSQAGAPEPGGKLLLALGAIITGAVPLWFVEPLSQAQNPMFGLTSWAIAGAIALGIGSRWRWGDSGW